MDSVITLYKHTSETPLEAIERFRSQHPQYATIKLGYAGRLDPMAEGLLLVLVGDENKKRKEYELLPKHYEFSFIPGIETDSYDMMGIIRSYIKPPDVEEISKCLKKIIPEFIGTLEQPYPPYSSARANGKPLYYWTRRNLLHTISVPTKQVKITNVSFVSVKSEPIEKIITHAIQRIQRVNGDFRQNEIIKNWEEFGTVHKHELFPVFHYSAEVSSGTYIRSLVHAIGKKLKNNAVTYTIFRNSVGNFKI